MAVAYVMLSVAFASLCTLVWILTGGSVLGAVATYLISGQVAVLAVIALIALRNRASVRSR